jgi:hypothetical protein
MSLKKVKGYALLMEALVMWRPGYKLLRRKPMLVWIGITTVDVLMFFIWEMMKVVNAFWKLSIT